MQKVESTKTKSSVRDEMLDLRIATGLTGTAFASIIGVTAGMLVSHERGRVPWREERVRTALAELKQHLERR